MYIVISGMTIMEVRDIITILNQEIIILDSSNGSTKTKIWLYEEKEKLSYLRQANVKSVIQKVWTKNKDLD